MNVGQHFRSLWSNISITRFLNSIGISDNAFAAFMEIPIKDGMEIPTIVAPYVWYAMNVGNDSIVMNLSSGLGKRREQFFTHKTVTAILSRFEDASEYETLRMAKVKTMKGTCYYGTRGLILDGDYNPIAMSTVRICKDDQEIHFEDPKFLVSYRVFEHSSELIEHSIIKQAIPMYHMEPVYVDRSSSDSYKLVDVVVDDLDYMVTKPALQPMNYLSQEAMNKVVYDNI